MTKAASRVSKIGFKNEATAVDTEKIQILIKSNNGFFSEHKSEMILKWLNLIVDQKTRNLGKSA